MKLKYDSFKDQSSFISAIKALLFSLFFCICCIPSFRSIGHFVFQMSTAAALSLVCTVVIFLAFRSSLKCIADSLSVFLLIMLSIAVYQQISAQLSLDSPFSEGWIYTFYYDKPLTVAIVWGVSFISAVILRLLIPFTEEYKGFRDDFSVFFKRSSRGFLIYYIFVLVYCFILQRSPQTQSGINLIPFNMIMTYINGSTSLYESLFYFTGNFICFLPFGFLYSASRKKREWLKLIALPVVISLIIEASQILLKNGNFDVDDIILNSLGFYLGTGAVFLFDFLRNLITEGKEKTIFD